MWKDYVFGRMSHPTHVILLYQQAKRYVLILIKWLIPLICLKLMPRTFVSWYCTYQPIRKLVWASIREYWRLTFNHWSSFWNLFWNLSWKIRLSFEQWYFDTPNRIHVRFRSEDRIRIKILDWGLFEKAKRKWGSIMPSKIQQSAMGLGSRYPLFENDFMQHGVR